ncbi:hypothetical protein T439DRAFT_308750 [Meredithblackwellia eburnea MCA 4105]
MTSQSSTHPLFESYQQHDEPYTNLPLGPSYPPQQQQQSPNNNNTNDYYQSQFTHQQQQQHPPPQLELEQPQFSKQNPARPSQDQSALSAFFAAYNTRNQIIFLTLLLVQTIAVLVMIALVYATINSAIGDLQFSDVISSDPQLETVATYLGLFILAEIFEILVALDSLMQKNIIELGLLLPFQVAMIVYSAVLPSQLHQAIYQTTADTPFVQKHTRIYAIVIPCVISAITILMSGVTARLYGEFGWQVFKRIGADIGLRKMYTLFQVFVCLLKFDSFFFIGFSIQFLVLVTSTPTVEKVITIAAVPIILACLVLAVVAVRLESKPGVYAFFLLDAAGMAYFIYKLVRIFDPSSGDRYAIAKKTLTIFSVVTFLMLLVTFIVAGLCMNNFGRGLKENIPPYTWGRRTTGRPAGSLEGEEKLNGAGQKPGVMGRTSTRMSLD